MYLSIRRSHHALLALSFFIAMLLTVFSTLLYVVLTAPFAPNRTSLRRYFVERGTWDDTLETFINADGDPSQFAVSPSKTEPRVPLLTSEYDPIVHTSSSMVRVLFNPPTCASFCFIYPCYPGSSSSVSLEFAHLLAIPNPFTSHSCFLSCLQNDTTTAITTVGYGEITPRSILGRLITIPLLAFGLLLIALPSFVLGREFSIVWKQMTQHEVSRLVAL